MSSLKLLISGSLVASGLILGAFTLHGAFDPGAVQKRSQTGRQEAQSEPKGVAAFRTRTSAESAAQDAASKAALEKAGAKQEARSPAKSADAQSDEAKARAEARRKRAEQKRAEKAEKEKAEREKLAKAKQETPPKQATTQWPWDYWFGN